MADGILKLNPAEARAIAQEMVKTASEVEDLLNTVYSFFREIDNEEEGIYQGSEKAVQLRGELEEFSKLFGPAYEQIVKSANDIVAIANRAEVE